jgi:hypothetical protein
MGKARQGKRRFVADLETIQFARPDGIQANFHLAGILVDASAEGHAAGRAAEMTGAGVEDFRGLASFHRHNPAFDNPVGRWDRPLAGGWNGVVGALDPHAAVLAIVIAEASGKRAGRAVRAAQGSADSGGQNDRAGVAAKGARIAGETGVKRVILAAGIGEKASAFAKANPGVRCDRGLGAWRPCVQSRKRNSGGDDSIDAFHDVSQLED